MFVGVSPVTSEVCVKDSNYDNVKIDERLFIKKLTYAIGPCPVTGTCKMQTVVGVSFV